MIYLATAFARRSLAPSVRNLGGAAFGTARLVEAENVPAETPEDIVNGCYDEAAAFVEALRGGTPKPSIAEVFPSVELCFAIARTCERESNSLTDHLRAVESERATSNAFSPTAIVFSFEFHGD